MAPARGLQASNASVGSRAGASVGIVLPVVEAMAMLFLFLPLLQPRTLALLALLIGLLFSVNLLLTLVGYRTGTRQLHAGPPEHLRPFSSSNGEVK